MNLVFLDEFGHIGPYVSRKDTRFNQSPVFGLAGFIMPHHKTRSFATWFLKLKENLLQQEIKSLGVHPATWEKKGNDLITTKNLKKYRNIQGALFRLINKIDESGGKIIYYGRFKYQNPSESNSKGLYTTVLTHVIKNVDTYCVSAGYKCLIILDQHAERIRLLESATKTMFGNHPARSLIEPPFQVESHLYQTIQASDWIATLIGRLMAYRLCPSEFPEWQWADRLFTQRLNKVLTHSTIWKPTRP